MARYACHDEPDLFEFEARVMSRRGEAVELDFSTFYPEGGGQPSDRGELLFDGVPIEVSHLEHADGRLWHCLRASPPPGEQVTGRINADFRRQMCQLHTDLHVLNALVFQYFEGALVTGAQIGDDGTARIDFDLQGVSGGELRALEPEVNRIIEGGHDVRQVYVPLTSVEREPGLIRSRSIAPPPLSDGTLRVIEISGVDRQACGGTHLSSTAESPPVRIVKVDNKGRHNRRVRIGLKTD